MTFKGISLVPEGRSRERLFINQAKINCGQKRNKQTTPTARTVPIAIAAIVPPDKLPADDWLEEEESLGVGTLLFNRVFAMMGREWSSDV